MRDGMRLKMVTVAFGAEGLFMESSFFCSQIPRLSTLNTKITPNRRGCWRCAYVEEGLADKTVLSKDVKNRQKKGRRSNPCTKVSAVATEDKVVETYTNTLDSLLLESAFRRPAFEKLLQDTSTSSKSMDTAAQPIVVRSNSKHRMGLASRINLHKLRLENIIKHNDGLKATNDQGTSAEFNGKFDIWSHETDMLIKDYGCNASMLTISWDKLPRKRLTGPEELCLARLMSPAKKLQQLKVALIENFKRDPTEEEWAKAANTNVKTLRRYLQSAQAARSKIIKHNLRLVAHQARKYYREELSLTLLDLCQEGVPGLIRAVDKFDPSKRYRFSTYAVYWVKNSILRAQTKLGHIVRVPYNVAAQKMQIMNKRAELTRELERDPTHAEVIKRVRMEERRYYEVMKAGIPRISLNSRSKITGEELIHSIAGPDYTESQYAAAAQLRFAMDDVLDSLKAKESLVIRQRYGLDGKGERSFTEIGRNLNLSREMVRKYEIRGMMKLRHPTRVKYLREYIM